MIWRRARNDDQKEQRRTALLDAAARLYATRRIEQVSLNAIAREANISKANVYRYFESREELFLHLTLDAIRDWRESVLKRLRPLTGTSDPHAVARAFAGTIAEHPRYPRLASVLATVLERNVSTEVVVRFKKSFLGSIEPLLETIGGVFPDMSPEDVRRLLEASYFLMVGLWPAAHPAPAVREALEHPDLKDACVDFEARFEQLFAATIHGIAAKQPGGDEPTE